MSDGGGEPTQQLVKSLLKIFISIINQNPFGLIVKRKLIGRADGEEEGRTNSVVHIMVGLFVQ